MKTKYFPFLLFSFFLAGCQSVSPVKNIESAPVFIQNDSWTGMHIDPVQFIAEENGFSCLAPSGVDFLASGKIVKKTLCFKTEKCETATRIFYLDAHSMLVTSMLESRTTSTEKCNLPASQE